jgi:hypothetical protein
MIRLRLGDLIRSNYSKFNIGRIFGHWDDATPKLTSLRQELQRLDNEKKAAEENLAALTEQKSREESKRKPGQTRSFVNASALAAASESVRVANDNFITKAAEIEKLKNPDNSITKSFESTGGKGLAGFITSLAYTWYDDNTTWEITPGSKAPMMCKITMQFSPVHDIPMGLDHNGFMRSYPYPVGKVIGGLLATSGSK